MEKRIPSPEELFGTIDAYTVTVSAEERKPIPGYRVVNRYAWLWLGLTILLAIAFFSINPFHINYYYMNSASMQSEIPKGSLVLVQEIGVHELKKGDIITFYNEKGLSVTHQIVDILIDEEELLFCTKGSDNKLRDEALIAKEQVVGKVIFHVPFLGKIFSAFNIL